MLRTSVLFDIIEGSYLKISFAYFLMFIAVTSNSFPDNNICWLLLS